MGKVLALRIRKNGLAQCRNVREVGLLGVESLMRVIFLVDRPFLVRLELFEAFERLSHAALFLVEPNTDGGSLEHRAFDHRPFRMFRDGTFCVFLRILDALHVILVIHDDEDTDLFFLGRHGSHSNRVRKNCVCGFRSKSFIRLQIRFWKPQIAFTMGL